MHNANFKAKKAATAEKIKSMKKGALGKIKNLFTKKKPAVA